MQATVDLQIVDLQSHTFETDSIEFLYALNIDQLLRSVVENSAMSSFNKSKIEAKLKLIQIVQGYRDQLKAMDKINSDELISNVCSKLTVLASGDEFLLEEGLINMYIETYEQKKKSKRTANNSNKTILFCKILKALDPVMK